jgi:hypothetical protein
MIRPCDQFGPWATGLDAAEKRARLRAIRVLARVHCGPRAAALCQFLAQAETDPAALDRPWPRSTGFPRTTAGMCWRPTAPFPEQRERNPMGDLIPFPGIARPCLQDRTSGIRVVLLNGRWCVERVSQGVVADRRFMPSQADAQRIAARISRRDKVMLLTARRSRPRPWPSFHQQTPDDAA